VKRAIGLAFALVLLTATPALAHVAVSPSEVPAGEAAQLTFSVPNETSDANTVKVEITLPADAGFEFVSVLPTSGWTHTEAKDGDAVTSITWEGGEIAPGEFQTFSISAGPIAGDSLEFKAVQTYDNGDVVRWIDATPASGDEPEHPAPTVTVTKGSGEATTVVTGADEGDGAEPIEFVSLAVAGIALVAALAALIMGRKRVPA
jgi:uncharacterized protein